MASSLRLGDSEPVAVQVEVIMIGAAPGPRLVVLGGCRMGARRDAFSDAEVIHEAVASVGVLRRDDNDERLARDRVHDLVSLGGEKVVSREQTCIR